MPSCNIPSWTERKPTALLVCADGSILEGQGLGASGESVGEVCFNTSMTGYQEILTDPSYTAQIIIFTFPHIGNTGTTEEDVETALPLTQMREGARPGARGIILRASITEPSNHRARDHFNQWLKKRGIIALFDVDTRALTTKVRETGAFNAVIAHNPDGQFDIEKLKREARNWPGLAGMDLSKQITCRQSYHWNETPRREEQDLCRHRHPGHRIVALDFGVKSNSLRLLAGMGCHITVLPATSSAEDVFAHEADAYFLSNGPGDPAQTAVYALPVITKIINSGKPVLGICLGHQIMGLALGARTIKMHQGHHGSNHPVKELATGKVDIVSMNHGFVLDRDSLPTHVEETHVSLFDGTNCGLRLKDRPVFSVQHHPEASPGPHDSCRLFSHFLDLIRT